MGMCKGLVVLLTFLLVGASATQWRRKNLKSISSLYSRWNRLQQNDQVSCSAVTWNSQILSTGYTLEEGWVVTCQSSGGVCYTTRFPRCCRYTGLEGIVTSEILSLGSRKINVTVLYTERGNSCLFFGPDDTEIQPCGSSYSFMPVACSSPPQLCVNNRAGVCDPAGCSSCKEGYVMPSCCECEKEYARAEDGSCRLVCKVNCNDPQCSSCAYPYTGPPFCCDCTPPFIKKDYGSCGCPSNYVALRGTCKPICTKNTVSCARPPCCKTGFKPPLCCECTFNKMESGELFFEDNGQCRSICRANAHVLACNVSSGCLQCEHSFKPPDCCDCMEPLELNDGVCTVCPLGYTVDGHCKENNILSLSEDVNQVFLDYFECILKKPLPCVSRKNEKFNYVCIGTSNVPNEKLEDELIFLDTLRSFLEKIVN